MLLYFVKSKNGTKCKNFAVLRQYIHSFVLGISGRGAIAPIATPLNPPLHIAHHHYS